MLYHLQIFKKGALYRQDAIDYFEAAIDRISLNDLDRFASLSCLTFLIKISETYEREHNYEKAIYWLKVLNKRERGKNQYVKNKISQLEERQNDLKPIRKRKPSEKQIEFERQIYEAALQYADLVKV